MSRIFSKTEETGFEDPLGNNFPNYDDFDLLRFVGNDTEIPIENGPSFYNNQYNQHQNTQLYAAVAALQQHLPQNQQQQTAFFLNQQQQQQQQHLVALQQQNRQHQMMNENFQLAADNNNRHRCMPTPNENNHQPMFKNLINSQTGLVMCSKDPVSERIGNKILHGQHLPDSPPNTESGGNSSASPSSSGCCTVNPGTVNPREAGQNSPYTPPSADFIQPHHHGSHQHLQQQLQKTGLLPNNAIRISQQQMLQRPQDRFSIESIPIDQTQTSPQSSSACGLEYVGGLPTPSTMVWATPSQSSSHSQMSPPSLPPHVLNNNNNNSHINLQRQHISDAYLLKQHPQSDTMFSTQSEQLYINAAGAAQCNCLQHCRQETPQQNCSNNTAINKLGNGIKRKRASSGNVADTAYCSTHYEGMGSQHHLTGGLMLDCGDNGREGSVGGIAHIVKTEAYTGIACGGSGSSLDGLNSNNSSRTGHVELDVDGYSPQSGPASSIPGGVGRLFGTVLENYDGLINSQNIQGHPVSHSQHSFDIDDIDGSCMGGTCGGGNKTIRFTPYVQDSWAQLYDIDQRELSPLVVTVVADKGFNHSIQDNCFVNQKKNHFQITVNIAVNPAAAHTPTMGPGPISQAKSQSDIPTTSSPYTPYYISATNDGDAGQQVELVPIENFLLVFCGAKSETPTSEIQIKQSQADRKPTNYEPCPFTLDGALGSVKQTVPRLHFSETTMNNHRKSGKPNPEQKYFLLVMKLMVTTKDGRRRLIQAFQSERVIVRASNPGQFEQPEAEIAWQKTQTMDGHGCLAFRGPVCIGTAIPEGNAQLTVTGGDIMCSGNIIRPSDRRVKEDIAEVSPTEALDRLAQMRIVEYSYKPEIAERWGLSEENRHRVGVIAQELAKVLPEAVRDNGEYLTIDESRVFFETTAAAQELQRLTEVLGCKLSQVEEIAQKVARITQMRKNKAHLTGSTWSGISDFPSWMLGGTLAGSKKQLDQCKDDLDERETKSVCAFVSSSLSHTSLTSLSPSIDDVTSAGDADGNSNGKKPHRFGATNTNKNRSTRKHRCTYRCQHCHHLELMQQPWPFDTPRHTNLVVMSLVLVMAFCLVGMFALFFLDWYQKTANTHPLVSRGQDEIPYHHRYPIQVNDPRGIGQMLELLDNEWTPPWQSPKLQLSATCAASSPSVLLDSLAEMAIPLLAASIPRCPKYCCSTRNEVFSQHSMLGDNQARLAQRSVLKKAGSNLIDSRAFNNVQLDEQFGSGTENIDDSHVILPKPLASGVQIFITGHMNVTIDSRYCIERSCDPRNGLHNLYIPVSPYIPTIPLHVQFSINDPTQFVDGCGPLEGFNHKECTASDSIDGVPKKKPTLTRLTEAVYELSMGSFLQSAYTFRVGHSSVPCRASDSQRGHTFDEYNLIFYRACSSLKIPQNPVKSSLSEPIKGKQNTSLIDF